MRRSRTQPGDSTRLILLGLLARYGPKHGYELRALIEEQHLDNIADVQYGSIYSGLKRLTRDGLLREAERSRAGNRPERVAFDITDEGRKQLRQMIEDAFLRPMQPERPVDLAVHFSGLLRPRDVAKLLRSRLEALDAFEAVIDRSEDRTEHDHPGVQAIIADIANHFRATNLTERKWTEVVLRRVEEEGGYPTPGRRLDQK